MKNMIIGQYIRGDSVIHRLDPRTKLVACLLVIIGAAWPGLQIGVLLFNVAFLLLVIHLAGLRVINTLGGLKFLWRLFLLMFIVQALLTPGEAVFSWGIITITGAGLKSGFITFLRLTILFIASCLLTMTTSSLELAAGLESLLSPLNYLRLPVGPFAMIINMSLRFIPTILEEAETLARVQKSRGGQFDYGPLAKRLKTAVAVMIPLIGASIQRATDMALTMESRCYSASGGNQYQRRKLGFTWKDVLALGLTCAILSLPWLLG